MPPASESGKSEVSVAAVIPGLESWLSRRATSKGTTAGARLGLLAHPASIDGSARHAVERLTAAEAVRLVKLFAPEHGLYGHEQDMERVDVTQDPASGLPVISLYGDSFGSLRPKPDDLRDLDLVMIDLQDVGSRYYTFIYTMSLVMEVAAEVGTPVVVLDRPNPIGGLQASGPVLDPRLASFVGRYALPVCHGMTIGELARLFNDAFGIGCDLQVEPMRGWQRWMRFEETGLPWVPPSPNMPTPTTTRVYPGGCLIEGTNLSEGRGTTLPFELVGAPWLDPGELTRSMRAAALPGVLFRPASFRPMFQKHAMEVCGGVQVIVGDSSAFLPFETYLVLLTHARSLGGDAFAWRTETYEFESEHLAIDLLLGRFELREMVERGAGLPELAGCWQSELEAFRELRRAYLLYD